MSLASGAILAIEPSRRRRLLRASTIIVALAFALAFVFVAQVMIEHGYIRRDIAALRSGDAWRIGGWLSQLVLRVVGLIPGTDLQQSVLSLAAAATTGLLFGVLYDRLRANGWWVIGAVAILLGLALHEAQVYTLTAASRPIPLYIAFAALIPAIRRLEVVGDVQSTIAFGCLLPLLLLASPVTTPLIIPLSIGAALAEPDGRRDIRAFLAMFLVAILPSVIVGIGIIGFVAQSGADLSGVIAPYLTTYGSLQAADPIPWLLGVATLAPVFIVPLAYCVWPGLAERRRVVSALAVVILPLYVAIAGSMLSSLVNVQVAALSLLVSFVSWLAMVRLPLTLRIASVVLMALGVVLSWTQIEMWGDAEWVKALTGALGLPPG